ncbi:MAG: hypothetical protein AAF149_16155 [Bacteroidota bacterium]
MMKITKELLKRHGMGLCTTEERKAVEEWFDRLEGPMMSTRSFQEIEENKEATWNKLTRLAPELESSAGPDNSHTIPLNHRIVRYAAAVSIILVTFFGGRFSAGKAEASPAPEDPSADHLFITGGDGGKGNLPGDTFRIQFDGTIKLFNNAITPKIILVGDTTFVLDSQKEYYLSGNDENARLDYDNYMSGLEYTYHRETSGGFSMLRIDQ